MGASGVFSLFALLAAPAPAQEDPPAAERGPAGDAIRLTFASLEPVGEPEPDEIVVRIDGLHLELLADDVELRADRAILWGDRDLLELLLGSRGAPGSRRESDPLRFGPEIPAAAGREPLRTARADALREIYAEGHVWFRQGTEQVLLAERLYQHLLERRGIVVDADAYGATKYKDEPVDVHVRARTLRSLGPEKLEARDATFSTCAYGHPHWHVSSDTMEVALAGAAGRSSISTLSITGNWLEIEDFPLLPLPGFTAEPGEGDSLPLKKVRAGSSTRFGGFVQTLWGNRMPEASAALTEELALAQPLTVGWELDADFYGRRGAGLGPALLWGSPGLVEGELGGYWIRDSASRDQTSGLPIEHEDRSRAYLRQRLTPADHWRLDTEVSWFSDAGFQPEFFEREFKEGKEPETYAHLVRQEGTTRWRALYRNRVNDFTTQVDALPRAGFDQVGEPLWSIPLPEFLQQEGRESHLVLTHYEDVANLRLHPADGSLLGSEQVVRADSALELSTSLPVGPASLRPFAAAQLTGWDRAARREESIGRAAGIAGARAQLVLHRDFDAWVPWASIDGLRHVVLLDADYVNAWDVSRDPDEIVQIDGVDALTENEVVLLGVRQRLRTHRGARVEDAFELDLELPVYPKEERDNPVAPANPTGGERFGPLRFDFVHRPGFDLGPLRNIANFAEGEWNLRDRTMDVVNLGFSARPDPDWITRVSWRAARDGARVLTGEVDWLLTEKWSVAALEQLDLRERDALEHRYELRRHGHDFTFVMGFERDRGDGEFALTFTIYPTFLRRGRAERGLVSDRGGGPSLADDPY